MRYVTDVKREFVNPPRGYLPYEPGVGQLCSTCYTTHMAHLTIYLSDDVERRVRKAAKAGKVSVSKWVSNQVAKSVETSWPPEFLALAGAFPDFPDARELRKGYGKDVPRESLD